MKVKNVLMAMVFGVAVLGGYQAYEQVSITNADFFLLENVEALANDETDSWWDSKVYDCEESSSLVFKCMQYKDLPDYDWKLQFGSEPSPNQTICGLFLEDDVDCVGGNSVAHCWEC